MSGNGWIGVDLDGTLAEYGKFQGHGHIGKPIPAMVERVKRWLGEGREVRIFTARASDHAAIAPIEAWCVEHIGERLNVTGIKDYQMIELWDDRAVTVEKNTGRMLGFSQSGLEPRPALPIGAAISCNRHEDCSRAPKGQLCCFDPHCQNIECQARR